MASASAARLSGDRFQHLFSWYELLSMLEPTPEYGRGTLEHPNAGAADDLVLERTTEAGWRCFQVKFHVDHRSAYSLQGFAESQGSAASSLLERLFNGWRRVPAGSEIWIVSNWSAEPRSLGRFISSRDAALTEDFYTGSSRSLAGKSRKIWFQHLKASDRAVLESERDFQEFCRSLRFRLGHPEATRFERIVDEKMRRHGLSHGQSARATAVDGLVRAIEEGEAAYTPHLFKAFVDELSLWKTYSPVFPINFDDQRGVGGALIGSGLLPSDTSACPELPEVEQAVQTAELSGRAWVCGTSGSGKSMVAYHTAKSFAARGWRVMEISDEWTVDSVLAQAGDDVVIILDDAQRFARQKVLGLLRRVSDRRIIIATSTNPSGQSTDIEIATQRSVMTVVDWMLEHPDLVMPALRLLDSDVGEGVGQTPIETRIERTLAAMEESDNLWQFNFLLTAGWRRAEEQLASLRNHDRADLCLLIVAIEQLVSEDAGAELSTLSEAAHFFGRDRDWIDVSLAQARSRKLIVGDRYVRTVHSRFAGRVLTLLTADPDEAEGGRIREYIRAVLARSESTPRGISRVLRELRSDYRLWGHRLVDANLRDLLARRIWGGLPPAEASELFYALQCWTTKEWFEQSVRANLSTLRRWVEEVSAESAPKVRSLLNEINNLDRDKKDEAKLGLLLIKELSPARIAASLREFEAEDCWSAGSVLGRLAQLGTSEWNYRLRAHIESEEFRELANACAGTNLASFSQLLYGFAQLDSLSFAESLVSESAEKVANALSRAPFETWRSISDLVFWVLGFAPPMFRPEDWEPKGRAAAEKIIESLDRKMMAERLGTATPRLWQALYETLAFIEEVSPAVADELRETIDSTSIEEKMSQFWNTPKDLSYPLAGLAASKTHEPARSILERHASEMTEITPIITLIHPELAVRLFREGLNLDLEAGSGLRWTLATKVVHVLMEVDETVAREVFIENRDGVCQGLVLRQINQWKGLAEFVEVVKERLPDQIQAIADELDESQVSEHWQNRLRGNEGEVEGVIALLNVIAGATGPVADLARTLNAQACG